VDFVSVCRVGEFLWFCDFYVGWVAIMRFWLGFLGMVVCAGLVGIIYVLCGLSVWGVLRCIVVFCGFTSLVCGFGVCILFSFALCFVRLCVGLGLVIVCVLLMVC